MSNGTPDPSVPKPPGAGRTVAWATVLGTILTPAAAWLVMLIVNALDPACNGQGGAEDSLGCVLRLLAVTILAIVPGVVIGVVTGLWLANRRDAKAKG